MRGTLRITQDIATQQNDNIIPENTHTVTEKQPEAAQNNAFQIKSKGIIFTYLPEVIRITLAVMISVAATIYIVTTYFYRPIVVLDLTSLVNEARQQSMAIADDQERVKYVAKYFDTISKDIKKRKEVVIVKEAIVNPEQFKEITLDYKTDKYLKPGE